jgi:hypothetical protein
MLAIPLRGGTAMERWLLRQIPILSPWNRMTFLMRLGSQMGSAIAFICLPKKLQRIRPGLVLFMALDIMSMTQKQRSARMFKMVMVSWDGTITIILFRRITPINLRCHRKILPIQLGSPKSTTFRLLQKMSRREPFPALETSHTPRACLGTSFDLGKYPQTVVEDSATLAALGDGHRLRLRRLPRIRVRRIQEGHRRALLFQLQVRFGQRHLRHGDGVLLQGRADRVAVLSGKGTATGLVMSEKILDNSAYYTSSSSRTVSGSTVYANNYQYSTLRAMLNGYDGSAYSVDNFTGKGFLDVAFTEAEKAYITTTTVDNSAATTESSSNSYACANTSDKIFALSYQDLINTSYGFNSSYSNYDTARRGVLTDYARATGAWMSTNSSYYGNGFGGRARPVRATPTTRGRPLRRLPPLQRRLRGLWRPSELHREHRLSEAKQSIRRRERIRA